MTVIPQWTTGDRLAKAREAAGVSRDEMAALLGVHINTVGNYERDHTRPTLAVLRVWSSRCEVPFEWLAFSVLPPDDQQEPQSRWTRRAPYAVDDPSQAVLFPRRVA